VDKFDIFNEASRFYAQTHTHRNNPAAPQVSIENPW